MSSTRTTKAIQAVVTLLNTEKTRSMDMLRLLKLLYLADRESIRLTGRAIAGAHAVTMDNGPLDAEVYELAQGKHQDRAEWDQFIDRIHYCLEVKLDPGRGCLSDFEVELLQEVAKRYADLDTWALVEATHELEEWKLSHHPRTSTPIAFESIIDAMGRGKDKEAILELRREEAEFDALFSRPY